MAYRIALSLPRVVERGRAASLTLPVVDDAGAVQTASGGTLSVWLGTTLLLDEVAIVAGPPASYALGAGSVPTSLALSSEWLEVWTLTGVDVLQHSGHLVRRAYHSHVVDADLERIHPEILHLLPPGEATAEKFRVQASEKIQRKLLNKGRRPWLIFEPTAMHDAEVYLALHYWAQDAALRTSGTSPYAQLARDFWAAHEREWTDVAFDYDADEDGLVDAAEKQTAEPSGILLSQGRARSRAWGAYR